MPEQNMTAAGTALFAATSAVGDDASRQQPYKQINIMSHYGDRLRRAARPMQPIQNTAPVPAADGRCLLREMMDERTCSPSTKGSWDYSDAATASSCRHSTGDQRIRPLMKSIESSPERRDS